LFIAAAESFAGGLRLREEVLGVLSDDDFCPFNVVVAASDDGVKASTEAASFAADGGDSEENETSFVSSSSADASAAATGVDGCIVISRFESFSKERGQAEGQ
jgi:hypothetical protein